MTTSLCTMTKDVCLFLLLMIAIFARAKSLCLSNCTIVIDPLTYCEITPCNGNNSCDFIYSSFSHALVDLDMLCGGDSVEIYLRGGEHSIEPYAYGINISKDLIIQGQNSTFISCQNIGSDQNITSLLLFYNATEVKLNNLELNSCGRPIRFNNISKVTISQCTFRYESHAKVNINFVVIRN